MSSDYQYIRPINSGAGYPLYADSTYSCSLPLNCFGMYGIPPRYFPTDASPFDMMLANNTGYYAMTNPMLYGVVNQMPDSPVNGYQWRGNYDADKFIKGLEGTATQISEILKSDQLSEEQKAQLQEKYNQVKEALEQLKELQKQLKETSDVCTAKSIADAITGSAQSIQEIQRGCSELAGKLAQEINAENEDGDAEDDGDAGDSDGVPAGANQTPVAANLRERHKQKVKDMDGVCRLIDKAVYYVGTNYDDNELGLRNLLINESLVNSDNILELFEQWDNSYAKVGRYKADKDGLIETLMDECEFGQKEEIASIIVDLLQERAEKYGIDVTEEVTKARNAMKANWMNYRDDDDIQDTVNALVKKVKDACYKEIEAGDKKTEETKKADESKKAEASKKQKEKIEQKKEQFIKDMKECLERDNITAIPAGVEVVTDSKGNFKEFKIRYKGKDYTGKDYLSLCHALEQAGLNPAEILK